MDKIIESVTKVLQQETDVIALFLFGSRATGKYNNKSDYDFFVILDKNTKDSLREDCISQMVSEQTKGFNAIAHLTFQYLFILEEDRSLLLKINDDGKLLFSKGVLFGSTSQFKLKKYYMCRWKIDKKLINQKKKRSCTISISRLQVSRLLKGYEQHYEYKGKKKKFVREGMIDNIGIFGEGELLIVIDSMLPHLKELLSKYSAKLEILNQTYMLSDNIDGIWIYELKDQLEKYLKKSNRKIHVRSVQKIEHNKLGVKYTEIEQKMNTKIPIEQLPDSFKKYLNYFKDPIDFER